MKISYEVKDCTECQFCKGTKLYTEDSWEHATDYWCTKVPAVNEPSRGRSNEPFKMIAGYIEWPSEMPGIPEWCPLLDPKIAAEMKAEKAGKFQGEGI